MGMTLVFNLKLLHEMNRSSDPHKIDQELEEIISRIESLAFKLSQTSGTLITPAKTFFIDMSSAQEILFEINSVEGKSVRHQIISIQQSEKFDSDRP